MVDSDEFLNMQLMANSYLSLNLRLNRVALLGLPPTPTEQNDTLMQPEISQSLFLPGTDETPAYNQSLALHTHCNHVNGPFALSGQFSPAFSSPYLESGHMVPTYKGLCTAFNAISLGDLLQDSHFVDIFSKVSMFDSFPIKRSIQNKKNLFPSHLSKKKSAFFFSRHSVLVNDSPPIRSLYLLHRSF